MAWVRWLLCPDMITRDSNKQEMGLVKLPGKMDKREGSLLPTCGYLPLLSFLALEMLMLLRCCPGEPGPVQCVSTIIPTLHMMGWDLRVK